MCIFTSYTRICQHLLWICIISVIIRLSLNMVILSDYFAESTAKPAGYTSIIESNDKVYMNGSEISLKAYKIDGSNYFRLRD